MTLEKIKKKPRKKTGGRKAGTPNKTTKLIKDCVLSSLEEVGGVDYLVKQAYEHPTAYIGLLAKVLPIQLKGDIGVQHSISVSLKQILERVDKNN